MGRRIRWLGVIMVACLGLVVAQLVNIQLVKAKAAETSPYNPRVSALAANNARGEILASDGTVLAQSVPTPAGGAVRATATTTSASTRRGRSTRASPGTTRRSTTARRPGSRTITTPTSGPTRRRPRR